MYILSIQRFYNSIFQYIYLVIVIVVFCIQEVKIMAKKKASKIVKSNKKCECGDCSIWMSVLVLIIGLLWLGKDLAWWALDLPYLPIIIILVTINCIMKSKE